MSTDDKGRSARSGMDQDNPSATEKNEKADAAAPPTRNVTAPRQSACVQAQLQILRLNLERLMSERTVLQDVKMSLRNLLGEMDSEILAIRRMRDMNMEAHEFYTELCANHNLSVLEESDEPQPHCSKNPKPK